MKILFLATTYEYGGVSSVVRNIMDNLNKKEFDITFVVERLDPKHYKLRNDIKFVNINVQPAKGCARKFLNTFRRLYRLRKSIISENPDIVLSFAFPANCLCLLAFLVPLKNKPKIILSEHTELLFIKEKVKTFKENFFRFIYKMIMFLLYHRAEAIVCVSMSIASHIKRFFLIDPEKVKVIHVPVNIEEIRIRSQEKVHNYENSDNLPCIGTISRLLAAKGVNYLIEAFSDLIKRIDARLIIVGDGEEKDNLEKMVRDLKIEDRVSFLGFLENPYNYLRGMDVFVLPSLYEGFPNVVIESMVCNVPVVATRSVGGLQELIDNGVNGLLVPPKDTKSLADSIYSLLRNKELKNRFSNEAYKRIDQFDSHKITKEYEVLMQSL